MLADNIPLHSPICGIMHRLTKCICNWQLRKLTYNVYTDWHFPGWSDWPTSKETIGTRTDMYVRRLNLCPVFIESTDLCSLSCTEECVKYFTGWGRCYYKFVPRSMYWGLLAALWEGNAHTQTSNSKCHPSQQEPVILRSNDRHQNRHRKRWYMWHCVNTFLKINEH